MKQFLNKEQMIALKGLNIDTSDAEFQRGVYYKYYAYHVGELIERLPETIVKELKIGGSQVSHREIRGIRVFYIHHYVNSYDFDTEEIVQIFNKHNELIDNLFDCYVQLIKDGVIN